MLSSRLDAKLRRTMSQFFTHTYSLTDNSVTPVLDGGGNPTYDTWHNQIFTNATTVIDKPCLFLYEDLPVANTDGSTLLHTPTLYVPADDAVNEKDVILSITSRNGVIILESATVESIESTTEINDGVLKVLRLSGATTV